jgi:hypothetical protein
LSDSAAGLTIKRFSFRQCDEHHPRHKFSADVFPVRLRTLPAIRLLAKRTVTSFTEAPRDNSYTNHTGHSPDVTGGRSPRDPKPSSASSPLGGFSLGALSRGTPIGFSVNPESFVSIRLTQPERERRMSPWDRGMAHEQISFARRGRFCARIEAAGERGYPL